MFGFFTDDGFIYGEGGHIWNELSPKGCRPIDIGYNVEETLALLTEYAMSSGDEKMLEKCLESARCHAVLLLPDGGWNNSFGTRMDKWTYWGSRTSDGCQPAYIMLSSLDSSLGFVADTNLAALERTTFDGLLYGGEDLHRYGEPPCVHHAFTHAEGLVKAREWAESHGKTDCEYHKKKGTVYIPEADTYIVNENGWRVTVTGNDSGEKEYCAPSGGAVSLLYHGKTGPLLVSSMTRFIRYEIMNTQRHMKCDDLPFTVRLQKGGEPVCYSNNLDKCAVIKQVSGNTFEANGKICGVKGENPPDGAVSFKSRYVFETDRAVFTYEHSGENIDLIFPAVIKNDEPVTVKDGKTVMIKNGTKIKIDFEGAVPEITRFFNHVPGFEGCELKITNVPQRITVTVELI